MRLYKPKYKGTDGKTKQVAMWWAEFRDLNGIVRRWSLLTTSKDVADLVARQIDSLNEWAKKHIAPPDELVKWVRHQDPKLREKIEKAGLLSASQVSQSKPLTEYLDDYKSDLLARNNTAKYAQQTYTRIARIIAGCKFRFWDDVEGPKITKYLRSLSHISERTQNQYVLMFRQFAKWLHEQGRIKSIPAIQGIKFDAEPRRVFELDEWPLLLKAAREGPVRGKMTGYERYVLYTFAMETGARLEEQRAVTPAHFDFNKHTVFIKNFKTKAESTQYMTPETTTLMKDFISGKMPNVRVFEIPSRPSDMIRADCRAAGIETENHKGTIVYHSLRHNQTSFLLDAGVSDYLVEQITRHKDLRTLRMYTHTLKDREREAINTLRGIGQEKQTKTETA